MDIYIERRFSLDMDLACLKCQLGEEFINHAFVIVRDILQSKHPPPRLGEFTRHVYMYTRAWQGYLFKGYLIIHL